MKRRNVLNSPRLEEYRRKKQAVLRKKILLFLVIFIVLLTGFSYLSRWTKLNIKDVQVSGNKVIDAEAIAEVARADISGRYLWLFPKTNFLLYPKRKIKKDLASEFKRLSSISFNMKNTNTLEVSVSEREGKYTWCGDDLPLLTAKPEDTECYFMDDGGYVFDRSPYFSGDVYLRYFGRIDRATDSPAGFSFLPSMFPKTVAFIDTLRIMGLKPSSLLVKTDGDIELYLSSRVSPPDSPKIIFKSDADFEKLVGNLQAAITTEPLQSEFKKKYDALLYIDLRFGNKVYYKFK